MGVISQRRIKSQYLSDEVEIELRRREEHVGAWVAIEHELAVTVGSKGDE